MKYRDIRPSNILNEKAMSEDLSVRFLWAGFGDT